MTASVFGLAVRLDKASSSVVGRVVSLEFGCEQIREGGIRIRLRIELPQSVVVDCEEWIKLDGSDRLSRAVLS